MASRRPPYLRASGQASPDPTALPPTPSLGEVDLRCRGCGARVTEWAADCPQCHRALDDATAIPHRPAGRPARQLHSRLRRRATKRRVIVAVATVFAVAAATTGFIALASTRRPAFLDGLPADLGRETLVVSGADKPGRGHCHGAGAPLPAGPRPRRPCRPHRGHRARHLHLRWLCLPEQTGCRETNRSHHSGTQLRAAVVNLVTGSASIVGPALEVVNSIAEMSWSHDGHWLG